MSFNSLEKLEIVEVQDFGSEFLAKPTPPQAAKCVRTIWQDRKYHHQLSTMPIAGAENSLHKRWVFCFFNKIFLTFIYLYDRIRIRRQPVTSCHFCQFIDFFRKG